LIETVGRLFRDTLSLGLANWVLPKSGEAGAPALGGDLQASPAGVAREADAARFFSPQAETSADRFAINTLI
jgi:hypothetical protein